MPCWEAVCIDLEALPASSLIRDVQIIAVGLIIGFIFGRLLRESIISGQGS